MQSWDLDRKIQVTTARIMEWYEHYNGLVYVAFSGGKDSTVLLDLVRRIYPDVPAVFCDTGLEFPEIRQFARSVENVVVLRPEMNFKKVIETYGYPIVSKRVEKLREIKQFKDSLAESVIDYVGIAFDEPKRFDKATQEGKILPLVQWQMTEEDCLNFCHERGFYWIERVANCGVEYMDLYSILDRISCWCCCNKNLKELRNIYRYLPNYWQMLRDLQEKIDRPFKGYYKGQAKGIFELEERFSSELVNQF